MLKPTGIYTTYKTVDTVIETVGRPSADWEVLWLLEEGRWMSGNYGLKLVN